MKRLILSICGFLMLALIQGHPLHLSVTNIILENDKLKVIMKTFPNDWETAYFHYQGKVIDLSKPENRSGEWFSTYLEKSFRLHMEEDGKIIELHRDSTIYEEESMTIELSAELREKPNSLYIYQSLLTDIYPDQTNLVIFVNGKQEIGIKFDVRRCDEKVLLK